MIVSTNSDCSLLVFVADYLTSTVSTDPDTDEGMVSVTLKYKTNCTSGNLTSVVVTDEITNITDNTLSLSPEIVYGTTQEKFCDGVYYFELVTIYNVIEDLEIRQYTVTESVCMFIDCDLKCKVIDTYNETKDANILLLYDVLKHSIDCDSCNCTTACDFYTELKCLINESIPSTTIATHGCGCN